MNSERLPLNALRAFAEAARFESFKRAGNRLNVTPGAISRQVKHLEEELGVPLFVRHANGVRLNEIGQRLARDLDKGFEQIGSALTATRQIAHHTPALTLSAPPTFLHQWLLPRLAEFDALVGGIDVSLDASQSLTAPSWLGEGARLAIRYGRGPWPNVQNHRLFGDELFPVCAPSLLGREAKSMAPEDLADHTLLDVRWESPQSTEFPGWKEWLEAAGVTDRVPLPKHNYSLSGLAMDQAIAGRGIMLATYPIVMGRLKSGVLVRPFGEGYALASPFTYDLLTPQTGKASPAVGKFIDWLLEEASTFEEAAANNTF